MGNGQIQSFVPASKMIAPFAGSKIRGNQYAYGFGGNTFWMDPNFGLNTYTDLAAVSSWIDKISNISFQQATGANQPRYVAAHASFNNLPVVQSVSTARFLSASNGLLINKNSTFLIVANYTSSNNISSVIGSSGAGNHIGLGGANAGFDGVYLRSNSTTYTGTTEDTTVKIAVITNNLIMVNGVSEATFTANFDSTYDTIFRSAAASNQNLIGNIAEILMFNRALTSAECLQLSNNINKKYLIY